MIHNPILKGFNPDPCICRKGDDFYLMVSSFEWMPALPIYTSRDLKHWKRIAHVFEDDKELDLKRLPSAKGIWAPSFTCCEEEDLFYVVYGLMNSMNARYFDVDNYMVCSKSVYGPWSKPVYLHSAGFDASMFHDDDGRKYIASLQWETREGYEKPGQICLAEYDAKKKEVIGYPVNIYHGGTDRGCLEAPHITKRGEYYYLMCAEGGTGYYHGVTMARSKSVWGPYEPDPMNPIVTSVVQNYNLRENVDHLKTNFFNPRTVLQKCGHGSYVNLENDDAYLVHLCSRPFIPKLRCTLGRETAIQKMKWTKEQWLRMANGRNLAEHEVEEADLAPHTWETENKRDDFNDAKLRLSYYSPRIPPMHFVDLKSRPGYLAVRGQESLCSLNRVSILAGKLTSLHANLTVKMDFIPKVYQHGAGIVIYYDNMNYVWLRKYYSQTLQQSAIGLISLDNGVKTEHLDGRIGVGDGEIYFRLCVNGQSTTFFYSVDGLDFRQIGDAFDTSKFSDEYCKFGEFTGTMVGIGVVDSLFHREVAYFDFFEYEDMDENIMY